MFDRKGGSRELFQELLRWGFDFITHRKGDYEPLPDSDFATVTARVSGQPDAQYELAESMSRQKGWPELWLIGLKKKNCGQGHIVAAGRMTWQLQNLPPGKPDLPAAKIPWRMFGRWTQENRF